MLTLGDIKALNIEASSVCNAACPFCSRNQKVRPYGSHRLRLSDFNLLPPALFSSLQRIIFAGNFGDFASNPDMPAIVETISRRNRHIFIGGETNGSMQTTAWWQALGGVWRNGYVSFALDGLADTHALHRRGTDFDTIIGNVRAFAAAGGQAHWKMIVFRHNQHQIEAAARMAQEIGCRRFSAISSRDYDETLAAPTGLPVAIKREVFDAYAGRSAPGETRVQCKPFCKGSLYLAADGTVHPCCLAHCMYISQHNRRFCFIVPLIEANLEQINFKSRPLAQIIQGPYFNAVGRQSQFSPYCRAKCHPYKNQARHDLVIHERYFP
jgi:MoaA/NifB/PqqE/SkfB family radical SAM enzyme